MHYQNQYRHKKRMSIYSILTVKQRKMLRSLGHDTLTLESIPMEDFKRITKNKQLIKDFTELKRSCIRLLAA